METGLIGLPLSGKTTIFNAVTGRHAATSLYAGGRKDMNIAEINVPDVRVDELSRLFAPKRTVHAKMVFKDMQIAFDERGGITPTSIAEIRNLTALAVVLRAFESDSVAHPDGRVDPAADLKKLLDSFIFTDYEVVQKRLERLEKEAKKGSREYQVLERLSVRLMEERPIGEDFLEESDINLLSGLNFITDKPLMVVANTGDAAIDCKPVEAVAGKLNMELFTLPGLIEMEIAQLEPADQKDFLAELGLTEPALNRFLQHIYRSLNLISFLTVGPDEVRAWSIRKGWNAQKAAGRIHSDLEKGFIRAEVVSCADLLALRGLAEARKVGKLRQEGKDYIVQDGDVMNVLFNV